MLFINTRPADRATTLSRLLQQHRIDVLELPLLALNACPWDSTLAEQYQQLLSSHVIVVVSPMAVEIGMRYLQQSGIDLKQIQHKCWIAVGEKTAQELARFGIVSHVPQLETSEGMLSLSLFKHLPAQAKIAFWRGKGGRQFMMQQLLAQGHEILNMLLYMRECPASTRNKLQNHLCLFKEYKHIVVLISSEASWLNWRALAVEYPQILNGRRYWVLGERLQHVLQQDQNTHQLHFEVQRLENLKPQDMLQQLQQLQGTL